jgi:hypothetical protein
MEANEFWAWVPTLESFAEYSWLGDQAPEMYRQFWDIDLHML